eukprot:TRINITY_DN3126_c0_g1_i3.p1 TRINITY_DN3126_c0_g1~~TRINITY_DN3126_c0_g1_i3.p1  ORF type:complete len:378 (-),score=86.97 TRINITY_DN3126_c0_g1_i3:323-1456(-)
MEVTPGVDNEALQPTDGSPTEPFFVGSIIDAIAQCKVRNCVFVVTLQGTDAESTTLDTTTWTNSEVQKALATDAIALRLTWDSPDGRNFLAIYPALNTPTIYFIAPTGAPLAILSGLQQPQQFLQTLHECQGKIATGQTVLQPSAATTSSTTTTTSSLPMTTNTSLTTSVTAQPTEKNNSAQTETPEAIQARVQEKLKKIREDREAEEKRAEKERELNRRRSGQEIQKAKTAHDDVKQRLEQEQRRKEQTEAKLAKDRVKAKIERDKQERLARAAKNAASPVLSTNTSAPKSEPQLQSPAPVTASTTTVIQFKLLDGSTTKHTFSATDTLQDCKAHLLMVINLFSLSLSLSLPPSPPLILLTCFTYRKPTWKVISNC